MTTQEKELSLDIFNGKLTPTMHAGFRWLLMPKSSCEPEISSCARKTSLKSTLHQDLPTHCF